MKYQIEWVGFLQRCTKAIFEDDFRALPVGQANDERVDEAEVDASVVLDDNMIDAVPKENTMQPPRRCLRSFKDITLK